MNRVARVLVVVAAGLPASAFADPPNAAKSDADAASDIVELRRAIGGAEGPSLLRSDDAQLAQEIQRLAAQDARRGPARPSSPRRGGGGQHGPVAGPPPHVAGDDPKLLLRETAFRLDALAHQLELKELVGQADELRRVATSLRHQARELGGPPLPASRGFRGYQPLPPGADRPGQLNFPAGRHRGPRETDRPAPERASEAAPNPAERPAT